MNPQRQEMIERAVMAGMSRWQPDAPEGSDNISDLSKANVLRGMPRRKITHDVGTTNLVLPTARRVIFKPGVIRPVGRLFVWLWAGIRFALGNAVDVIRGRATIQRRAARLRKVFEDTGASFTKLGQQLSLRADLLPYAYCAELSKMLDQTRPIPTAQAIATIEKSLGRPINHIFETFDPEPIGSASLACVYQATLKSGQRVAVKVRRPGIGQMLAADLRALSWLLITAEALTIIRPGLTREFRQHLGTMLMSELNFRAEARFTEIFRRRSNKDGEGITAPRVYFEYCTDEVLVNELVSGVWMWELMAAIDRNDQEFLSYARSIGIDAGVVARRLVRSLHRQLLEHLFFHADPHPANMVVLPNSRICFIDFGAVGRFSTETRNTWRELQYHMANNDITRMVHCSIHLAGRIPPIDVDRALKAMEEIYADWVYAANSTDAEWWERSTAQTWLRYINVAQHFGIPASLETLHFFRATFLYDSMIVRLDKTVDPIREWGNYAKQAGKDARKRVLGFAKKRIYGPTNMDYVRVEQLADIANQFVFRLQRSVEDPIVNFRNIVGKIAYSLSMLLRVAYLTLGFIGLSLIARVAAENWFGHKISLAEILETVTSNIWLQIIVLLALLVVIRHILIRLNEPDQVPDTVH
jgi:ubiquinone biosynthesis protein